MDKYLKTKELIELAKKNPKEFEKKYLKAGEFEKVSLPDYLGEILEEKGLKVSDVVTASILSKSYTYQVFSGERTPSRDILIRLGIGMKMNVDEVQKMLLIAQAGSLYPKVRRDAAIICCISQGFSVAEAEEFLEAISEESLL